MTIFENVKTAVSVRDAAERYGLKVSGNNMICCPFHNDRHPSMKLNRDYFYCFGCGQTGDVIDFVGQIFGLAPIDAARKLAVDFGVATDIPISGQSAKTNHPKIKAFREDEQYCFKVICDYLHLLEEWKVKYSPKTPNEDYDDRFVEACQMIDYVENLADILAVGSLEERTLTVKKLLSDGRMPAIESMVAKKREEENNEQEGIRNAVV